MCRGRHRAACTGVRVVLLVRRGDASQAQCAQASLFYWGEGGERGGGGAGRQSGRQLGSWGGSAASGGATALASRARSPQPRRGPSVARPVGGSPTNYPTDGPPRAEAQNIYDRPKPRTAATLTDCTVRTRTQSPRMRSSIPAPSVKPCQAP